MKAAFATWNNRIAPVFDAVEHMHIVEIESGRVAAEHLERFGSDTPVKKVLHLVEWGVDTLVCGAVSQPVRSILIAQGIEVVDFVAGDLHQVVHAWLNGTISDPSFAMPGRCSRKTEAKPNRYFQE